MRKVSALATVFFYAIPQTKETFLFLFLWSNAKCQLIFHFVADVAKHINKQQQFICNYCINSQPNSHQLLQTIPLQTNHKPIIK